jgi:hypothetical protein
MHQPRIQGKTVEVSFYEELQHVLYHLPMVHIKIMLGEFNAILVVWTQHLLNQQLGMTANMKIAVLMVSD